MVTIAVDRGACGPHCHDCFVRLSPRAARDLAQCPSRMLSLKKGGVVTLDYRLRFLPADALGWPDWACGPDGEVPSYNKGAGRWRLPAHFQERSFETPPPGLVIIDEPEVVPTPAPRPRFRVGDMVQFDGCKGVVSAVHKTHASVRLKDERGEANMVILPSEYNYVTKVTQ